MTIWSEKQLKKQQQNMYICIYKRGKVSLYKRHEGKK